MNTIFSKNLSLYIILVLTATPTAAESAARSQQFSPCPESPNCVSTQSTAKARFIEPLQYTGSLAEARQKLINILENTKRVRMVKDEPDYIHAEFRSGIFKFVDDVEFYFPDGEKVIHVKSASRSGYYDFGVNRRRVERLRSEFKNRKNNLR